MHTLPVLMRTDAYKLGHVAMYPEDLVGLYSNFTHRSSRLDDVKAVVNFGLQGFITELVEEGFAEFFAADVEDVVAEYAEILSHVLGDSAPGTDHVRALHALGYVPLEFAEIPEGTEVPFGIPCLTVTNTVDGFGWLVNYIESALSASVWHPSTIATLARRTRKYLDEVAEKSGVAPEFVDFQLHDFSFRGQTSIASSAASGAGHLLSFSGSDAVPAIWWIRKNYPGDDLDYHLAGSIPASEHSVMSSYAEVVFDEDGTRLEVDETQTYAELLDRFPNGLLSLVSDTYDLFAAARLFDPNAGNGLYEKLMARDGTLVFRPDSGDPVKIVCGDPDAPEGTDENKGLQRVLYEMIGGTMNEKGFIDLDSHVGIIYGDGMSYDRIKEMSSKSMENGFMPRIVYGAGSYSYQFLTRDVFNSAMKATYARFRGDDGEVFGRALMKDPVTGRSKTSARGLLAVLPDEDDGMKLVQNAGEEDMAASLIQPIWRDGQWIRRESFSTIRERLATQ